MLLKARKFFPLLVVAAGLLAYHNSFTGGFFHDDFASIPENPTIQRLWPIWRPLSPPHRGELTVEGRPLINLSLAVNYALGGYNVWGYHALNLTVHILAGLTLLGIVRRTLLTPTLVSGFGAAANELGLAVAVLWTIHPLQTESVTYIIQRAESIMGLFYLLTLYCFIRGVELQPVARNTHDEPRARLWYGFSVIACGLGMASKEVMVSAPVMVMVYDRAFVSGSFQEAWHRRRPLYLALAGTWILLGILLVSGQIPATSTNAQRFGLTWWKYLATEPGVILYYLRLSVWPSPLSLNHPWPIARTWTEILPSTVVVAMLLAVWAWAWKRNPVWGFMGAWFFLILAPSSSFVPLHDPIFEHRMYLPLAAVVSLVVMGLYSVAGRHALTVFVVAAIGLGFLTWRHNQSYYRNPQYNLALALDRAGRTQEAIDHYQEALRIIPDDADLDNNLANALLLNGKIEDAIGLYEQALQIQPDRADVHNNLGFVLVQTGNVADGVRHYEEALRIKPDFAGAHYNLGVALTQLDRVPEAITHWEQTLRLQPDMAIAHYNLGVVFEQEGRIKDAIGHYEEVLRLKPDFTEAQKALARLRAVQ